MEQKIKAQKRALLNKEYLTCKLEYYNKNLPPIYDRLLAGIVEYNDAGCWLYKTKSYGCIDGRLTHIISYVVNKGAIPERVIIRHSCDNPRCVNPEHLDVGTIKDNIRDRDSRGRHWVHKGPANYRAKLTYEDVEYLRAVYVSGHPEFGIRALARKYGVNHMCISRAIRGITYSGK